MKKLRFLKSISGVKILCRKAKMFQKTSRHFYRGENMDDYLASLGFWRKNLPKDGASLYRAVAEQVFGTQALHEHVKKACVSYIDRHRADLVTHGAGPTEMKALSMLYKKDFVIFQHVGRPAVNLTNNGFTSKICLCVSNGNHYDEVYPQSYIESAAISQSILYELLYEQVFGIEQPVNIALDMIDAKPGMTPSQKANVTTKLTNGTADNSGSPDGAAPSSVSSPPASPDDVALQCSGAPFPYRVAKLLSPYILRNVEHDVWLESRKGDSSPEESPNGFQLVTFAPGDKCQVMLDGHDNHLFNAHIQEVKTDSGGIVVVFVEELGIKKQVPLAKLIALPKVVNFDNSWKKKGKKKNFESPRAANGVESGHGGVKGRQNGQFYSRLASHFSRRVRINSAGHPIKSHFMDNAHLQPRKSVSGYPNRKDLKTPSPTKGWTPRRRQRYNSEPGDNHTYVDVDLQQQLQHGPPIPVYWDGTDYNTHRQCESNSGDQPDVFYSSDGSANGAGGQLVGHNEAMIDGCMNRPDVTMLVRTQHCQMGPEPQHCQLGPEPVRLESPPSTMTHVLTAGNNIVTTLPYYNVVIPVMDNFGGPINLAVAPSVDPLGSDLPFNDCSTMRFFFNLGIQYYRISSCLQQQQHQPPTPLSPFMTSYPVSGPAGLCVTATPSGPVCTADVFFADETVAYGPCVPGVSPPAGSFFPAPGIPPQAQYIHYMPAPVVNYQHCPVAN